MNSGSSAITKRVLAWLVLLTTVLAGHAPGFCTPIEDGDGLPSELVAAIESAQAELKPILIYAFNPI